MRPAFYTAQPQQNLLTPFAEGPALAGMDGTVPLYNMPEGTAVYLYNIVPADYGLRVRDGFHSWADNIPGDVVKSIIPFSCKDTANCRLFAVTSNGIFDVTLLGTTAPTAVVTFPDTTDEAGYVSYVHFTDPNGDQTLLIADSKNGMYEYNPNGAVWTKYTTEITGADPAKVAFLVTHKARLWMIERDAAEAWYLPPGQKNGAASRFQFGSKMRHGGFLVGLYNWTIDGGNGLDDYLLAFGKGGDMLAYQGSDPALSTTWNLVGNWFVGQPPAGRRIATESGGDVIFLTSYGLLSAGAVMQGVDPARIERDNAGKIAYLLRDEIRRKRTLPFWELKVLAEEGGYVINTPRRADQNFIQFVLDSNRITEGSGGGWGFWRGVPATTFEPWNGDAFFGTEDGRVCRMAGFLDDVPLVNTGGSFDLSNWDQALWAGPLSSVFLGGNPIEFSMLSRFSDLGAPAYHKQVQYIRPAFTATNQVEWNAKAIYDFRIAEYLGTPVRPFIPGGRYDIDNWDQAVWSGLQVVSSPIGGSGYGRSAAIAIRGTTVSDTRLINIEGAWQPWNFL